MVLASLQLDYADDVSTTVESDPGHAAERLLDRAVHNTTTDIPHLYAWHDREDAVLAIRARLATSIQTLERSRLSDGIAYNITYNGSHAQMWATTNCRRGPDTQFGSCASIDGVAVQDRAGDTHVLAVAFDITVTTADGYTNITTVIPIRIS